MKTCTAISDYAIIGNCRSAALISKAGSTDWLCWPVFDSPALFSRLIDSEGGYWSIAPVAPFTSERAYSPGTNVLMTTSNCESGSIVVTDLMTIEPRESLSPYHELVRVVNCIAGFVPVEVVFKPTPGFGQKKFSISLHKSLGIRLSAGSSLFTLLGSEQLFLDQLNDFRAVFTLTAGQKAEFSLSYAKADVAVLPPLGADLHTRIEKTRKWWVKWSDRSTYSGPYLELVKRSALLLKLLCHSPTGAIIAAPTTSLPERLGGDLNWDYRYCWLRDATLTVRALYQLGYDEEAEAYVNWLLHTTRLTRPELKVLYDIYGRPPKKERFLEKASGYRSSTPVRVGNTAATQVQMDVYGEVIKAVTEHALRKGRLDRETSAMLRAFGRFVADHWGKPDSGIWEFRERPQHYTHSRVLCWAALDGLLSLAQRDLIKKLPVVELSAVRDRIYSEIENVGWQDLVGSYVQKLSGPPLADASLLLFPSYCYLVASVPRMVSTCRWIRERLSTANGLLYRHELSESMQEGAFAACSFWLAEALASGAGSLEDAEAVFLKLQAAQMTSVSFPKNMIQPRVKRLEIFRRRTHT